MENVVPTVIAAKHLFEKEHDPLLKDLLLYLKELMQVSQDWEHISCWPEVKYLYYNRTIVTRLTRFWLGTPSWPRRFSLT